MPRDAQLGRPGPDLLHSMYSGAQPSLSTQVLWKILRVTFPLTVPIAIGPQMNLDSASLKMARQPQVRYHCCWR
jgi:hypothetical protein